MNWILTSFHMIQTHSWKMRLAWLTCNCELTNLEAKSKSEGDSQPEGWWQVVFSAWIFGETQNPSCAQDIRWLSSGGAHGFLGVFGRPDTTRWKQTRGTTVLAEGLFWELKRNLKWTSVYIEALSTHLIFASQHVLSQEMTKNESSTWWSPRTACYFLLCLGEAGSFNFSTAWCFPVFCEDCFDFKCGNGNIFTCLAIRALLDQTSRDLSSPSAATQRGGNRRIAAMSYQRIARVEAAADGKALRAVRIMGMTSKEYPSGN